jgi:group II intron reverse transcriptase/maturase
MAKGHPKKLGKSLLLTKGDRVGIVESPIEEVREMRTAETITGLIHERGRKRLPLERVYRLLFNPEWYLEAYGKMYRNKGAVTQGTTEETADGMSLDKIESIIQALRNEMYQWSPAKRVSIEKRHSTKKRPLGMPMWSDEVLQEGIRLILNAYYEPLFSEHSHGFREERGCHTALREIYQGWPGTTWYIEGDISGCFDTLDHQILLSTLKENIHDGRFLHLIEGLLEAGYMENWKWNETLSGSPQGGIISPLLANIYLDKLDKFVEEQLIPVYTTGEERTHNAEYNKLNCRAYYLHKKGRVKEALAAKKQAQHMPSRDPYDPNFRRLRYVRYADDFLLGFIGPKKEAEEIKQRLGRFLQEELKLELSRTKMLLTHARTEAARFLGYEVSTAQKETDRAKNNRRTISSGVELRIPQEVIREKCQRYLKDGKAIHRTELVQASDCTIMALYQSEYRGLVEYYRLAHNLHSLHKLKWIMEQSLVKTLAYKLKISVKAVYDKYQTTFQVDKKPYKGLQAMKYRDGKEPLIARWGGIPLKWNREATMNDQPRQTGGVRSELVQRLLANA